MYVLWMMWMGSVCFVDDVDILWSVVDAVWMM